MWWIPLAALAAPRTIAPVEGRDGERVERPHAITFGLVGGLARATPEAWLDLQNADLAFVVSVGDAVERSSRRQYRRAQQRLGALPITPLPGVGEARGDRDLGRFFRAWGGLGVRGASRPTSWRAFDLVPQGARWRVLVVDADAERLGDRFLDELIWLPKVTAPLTEPLIVVSNEPVTSLVQGTGASDGARRLHDQIRRHTDPMRAPLFVSGGGAPELVMPGGPWGEAWLTVGQISGPPATLVRVTDALALDAGFDEALVRFFSESTDVAALSANGPYTASSFPLQGWWRVTIGADALTATLRMAGLQGWTDVHTIRWSRAAGWE